MQSHSSVAFLSNFGLQFIIMDCNQIKVYFKCILSSLVKRLKLKLQLFYMNILRWIFVLQSHWQAKIDRSSTSLPFFHIHIKGDHFHLQKLRMDGMNRISVVLMCTFNEFSSLLYAISKELEYLASIIFLQLLLTLIIIGHFRFELTW